MTRPTDLSTKKFDSIHLSYMLALVLLGVLSPKPSTVARTFFSQQLGAQYAFRDHTVAQSDSRTDFLAPGKPIERELAGGESHSYQVKLAAGQFCDVVVDQRGIDVIVAFYGPDGQKLVQIDSPNDVNGPEPLSLVANASSNYRLEVRSPNRYATRGRYEIRIQQLRPSTPRDESRITALKTYTEAKSLRDQKTVATFHKAIEKYQEALSLWRILGDRTMEAYHLFEMGVIYGDLGEYQKALDSNTKALAIYKAIGDVRGHARALNNIGYLYSDLGEHQKAIDFYEEALKETRAVGDHSGEPIKLSNIGAEYAKLGQYQKALDAHLQVIAIRRARGDQAGQAITLNNIANCYQHLGKKAKALDYYGQALIFMPFLGNAFYTATTVHNIGALYLELGDHDRANANLRQALVLRQTIGDRSGEAATLSGLARLERDRGNFVEAREHIEGALVAVESLRINVKSERLRASFLASVRQYYEFHIDILMQLHKQRPTEGFDAAALQASEKGRARSLLELLHEANAQIKQGIDPSLIERERFLRQSIADMANSQMRLLSGKHTEDEGSAAAKKINALVIEYEQVQAQIRQTSPRYAALTQPVPLSLKQIQSELLDKDTVLLEYALGQDRSFVWAVTPTSISSLELPRRAEIEAAARRVYDLITASHHVIPDGALADAEYTKAVAALGRMLLDPIASEIRSKRLLIVSEGLLQYIPFSALPEPLPQPKPGNTSPRANTSSTKKQIRRQATTPDSITPLVVSHEVITLPSASVLGVLRRDARGREDRPKTVAVFADPVFDSGDVRVALAKRGLSESNQGSQGIEINRSEQKTGLNTFPRLRFSRQEAESIVRLASKDKSFEALDFAANRGTAIGPELRHYRIVHFATHGLIDDEHIELSGIVLSLVNEKGQAQDGFLRLYDIYNLSLNADLVVISACKTALGKDIKGEGLIGLTRSFMYAGATRVVASLWQTDDRATATLMSRFYKGLLEDNLSPAAALRNAQLSMWKDNRWREPRFWAAFTLQGEWR